VNIDRMVVGFAGCMVLTSLILYVFHSHHWLWFTAFVGANLLQSAFTTFCPLAKLFKLLGIKPGNAYT
jgi:hypothetical protein